MIIFLYIMLVFEFISLMFLLKRHFEASIMVLLMFITFVVLMILWGE